jgi:hypothetical protein
MGGDGEALRHSGVTQKRDMPDEVRATYGTSLVFAHLLISIVHGTAHLKLHGGFLGYRPTWQPAHSDPRSAAFPRSPPCSPHRQT